MVIASVLYCLHHVLKLIMSSAKEERTFIMVKPDGVQRGLVGKIIKRFEAKGFKLVALKFTWVSNAPAASLSLVARHTRPSGFGLV